MPSRNHSPFCSKMRQSAPLPVSTSHSSRDHTREHLVKMIRVAQRRLEKAELLVSRFGWCDRKPQRDDRRIAAEIFQVRVQHLEKHLHVSRRGRDFEGTFVARVF